MTSPKEVLEVFLSEGPTYQRLYRNPMMGGGGAKTCSALWPVCVNLNIPLYWRLSRYEFASEMAIYISDTKHATANCLMTCSICKCTDRQRDRFTMFNVYISGAAVSQGCNVVRPKHGNISSLVSGYVAKMKMHDKIGGELKTLPEAQRTQGIDSFT